MLELAVVAGSWLILRRQMSAADHTATAAATPGAPAQAATLAPRRANAQLTQLTNYADRLFTERKWLAAEKAYLNVLKLDHKNVTAYVHLGIIFSTQKNMPDAIECFQIAVRLKPSGTNYQNLALTYYDNRNYIKSIAAYEKAIIFGPLGARYVGLGKAHLKLKNITAAVDAFEHAVELDPTKRTLERLAEAYDQANRPAEARKVYARIHKLDPTDREAARQVGIHLPDPQAPSGA